MTSSTMQMFSTRGIDLSVLNWDTVTSGAWLLCMQALKCMQATLGTHFGPPIAKGWLALVVWVMVLSAAGAEVVVSDELEDVRSA